MADPKLAAVKVLTDNGILQFSGYTTDQQTGKGPQRVIPGSLSFYRKKYNTSGSGPKVEYTLERDATSEECALVLALVAAALKLPTQAG